MSKDRCGPLNFTAIPGYKKSPGLWVITVYYNPCRYKTRRDNYDLFAEFLRKADIPLLTIECAFGDDDYELPDSLEVVHVRSKSLLWQKERLLNLAASWLPNSCTAVAWLDCDIIFLNPSWAEDTVRLLQTHAVVQVFETALRLEYGNMLTAKPNRVTSFGAIAPTARDTLSCGRYDAHGHTGYGWAMRREVFDSVGLYEHAVTGSADHFMAHAIYGEYGFCIENALKKDPVQIEHLKRWGEAFYEKVRGSFAVVPGEIIHLWHGDPKNRDYFKRMWKVTELGFNPDCDLVARPGQPLEWADHVLDQKPQLVAYFRSYFESRKEDTTESVVEV